MPRTKTQQQNPLNPQEIPILGIAGGDDKPNEVINIDKNRKYNLLDIHPKDWQFIELEKEVIA